MQNLLIFESWIFLTGWWCFGAAGQPTPHAIQITNNPKSQKLKRTVVGGWNRNFIFRIYFPEFPTLSIGHNAWRVGGDWEGSGEECVFSRPKPLANLSLVLRAGFQTFFFFFSISFLKSKTKTLRLSNADMTWYPVVFTAIPKIKYRGV